MAVPGSTPSQTACRWLLSSRPSLSRPRFPHPRTTLPFPSSPTASASSPSAGPGLSGLPPARPGISVHARFRPRSRPRTSSVPTPRPHLDSESSLGGRAAGGCAPRLSQLELFSMAREQQAAAPSAAAGPRCRARSARGRSRCQPRAGRSARPEAAMFPQPAPRARAVGSRAPWRWKSWSLRMRQDCPARDLVEEREPKSTVETFSYEGNFQKKICKRNGTPVCQKTQGCEGLGAADSRKMRGMWAAYGMRGEVGDQGAVFKDEVSVRETSSVR